MRAAGRVGWGRSDLTEGEEEDEDVARLPGRKFVFAAAGKTGDPYCGYLNACFVRPLSHRGEKQRQMIEEKSSAPG